MSTPINHHFLPVFYLSRWTTDEEDGRLCVYKRLGEKVAVRGYYPSGIGYRPNLYAVPGRTDPASRQELESHFMSPLDSDAAEAIAFIEKNNRKPEDNRLRSAWSRFIMSLLFRSPEQLQWLRGKIRSDDGEALKAIALEYEKLRCATDPTVFAEYRTEGGSGLLEEADALLLRKLIDSPRLGLHLNNMRWVVGEFRNQTHGLLTSDSPLITSNGIGAINAFVILPISPSKFFLAANTDNVIKSFIEQPPPNLERGLNLAVVSQSEHLVIGHTRRHCRFIENHMGRAGTPIKHGGLNRAFWRASI